MYLSLGMSNVSLSQIVIKITVCVYVCMCIYVYDDQLLEEFCHFYYLALKC